MQLYYYEKVIQFMNEGNPNASNVYAYLTHMQRHIVRRDQGKGNKCSRCCLWFNQKSCLTIHQRELHDCVSNSSKYTFKHIVKYSSCIYKKINFIDLLLYVFLRIFTDVRETQDIKNKIIFIVY